MIVGEENAGKCDNVGQMEKCMDSHVKSKGELWAILGTNFAVAALVITLFTWNRAESRSDYRHHDAILISIQEEMKDFHGRLCAIEERGRK